MITLNIIVNGEKFYFFFAGILLTFLLQWQGISVPAWSLALAFSLMHVDLLHLHKKYLGNHLISVAECRECCLLDTPTY